MSDKVLRIAAVGDLHCTKRSQGSFATWLSPLSEQVDVLLLVGDLTDYGTAEETDVLVAELSAFRRPILAVLGNHDFECEKSDEVTARLSKAGVIVLDGDTYELQGIGFVGVKGFMGGFGARALEPWGEPMVKKFVREAVEEALKLESALARLRTPHKVVMLHYAPILATVAGEPADILPFLGSSRLEEAIDRYQASVVFHGHAHRGAPVGQTRGSVPVYNVAMPLLRRLAPTEPPVRFYEIPLEAEASTTMAQAAQ